MKAQVFHARDSVGREVDVIVQLPQGGWAGFEVKLASDKSTLDGAAKGLLAFAEDVNDPFISLNIITASGPSYRRSDGVNVVSFNALAP